MTDYATIGRELESGKWAEISPVNCPCYGRGWFLSDFDTWHQCPIHGDGVPHPDDEGNHDESVLERNRLRMLRKLFAQLRQEARDLGYTGSNEDFNRNCRTLIVDMDAEPSPNRWVHAAWLIMNEVATIKAEDDAHGLGFTCALERELEEEAEMERWEAGRGFRT